MKPFFKKRQKGFTLVELGIVVAIAAVIIGIALAVVPALLASTRANAEISQLPTVTTKIQRAYANAANFAAVTTAAVVNLNVFPDSQVDKVAVTISNRWGGSVTVAPATLVNANDGVAITETLIPTAECLQIGQGVEGFMRKIAVGTAPGIVVKVDGTATTDPVKLGTECQKTNANTMIFTVGK